MPHKYRFEEQAFHICDGQTPAGAVSTVRDLVSSCVCGNGSWYLLCRQQTLSRSVYIHTTPAVVSSVTSGRLEPLQCRTYLQG